MGASGRSIPSEGPRYKSITPGELKERLDRREALVLLDVREPWEVALARIEGSKLIPMAEILDRAAELDPEAYTVVICHHGARSAYVTQLLDHSSFEAVYNLEGGLDTYSAVDDSVPRY
ncbi:MAG TPA: rhodanese-like domain-containing protein [Rubrobacteraceae bacterium]|nr:rhodanese-like domain-containing protein [Rubrobacteraceae bacterium]